MRGGSTPAIFTHRESYRTMTRLRQAIASVLPWRRTGANPSLRAAGGNPARIESLESRQLLASMLEISEIMADNEATLADVDKEYFDWIEIHNAGSSPANLNGYYLTDDPARPRQWAFPDVTLGADQYLVVFASGKNRRIANQQLHTSFSLGSGGETLMLVEPNGSTIASEIIFPAQETDISYGTDATTGAARFFAKPTPGARNTRAEIVINEIHYNPDIETELVEFLELHNPGSVAVDLSGAYFSDGITYTFPAGATLAAGGYLILAQDAPASDLADFQAKFGKTPFGRYTGNLSSEGETVTLRNKSGGKLDEVSYKLGFPWPTVGGAPGYSIELINPDFDNNLGGNWRSYSPIQNTTLFTSGGSWDFRKGSSEASSPKEAWRNPGFIKDATWYTGNGPIGYENDTAYSGSPQLQDMKGNYTSFFLRKTFTAADISQIATLQLQAMYDDGFVVWLNGNWIYTQNVGSNNPNATATSTGGQEYSNFRTFTLSAAALSHLQTGTNVLAVQVFNTDKTNSTDAYFDARLIGLPPAAGTPGPTPGGRNSIYATNAAPQMRQVSHSPQQPMSNQAITVTAKVTDPQGVSSVNLQYQVVDPGNYIRIDYVDSGGNVVRDPAYSQGWITLAMKDDGTGGDATAGDGIYTVQIPASVQTHRRLIRYRLTATDGMGLSITAPYADDPTPNFAYYVYDGMPVWNASTQPGGAVEGYDFNQMASIPVYQLLTQRTDHADAQHIPNATTGSYGGDLYKWNGTLIYDGVVYDNIHYRARGGVWRYAMGKNMWKFDFNRGHYFQARDEYGNLLDTQWSKLNLGANIQQGNFLQRGEQGLFEYAGFKLFNLAGAPSPKAFPIQFRIVENGSETNGTASQYDDDFQGLYLAVEQPDGRFLEEHGLPDGNLYKMEGGTGELNNQGPTQPNDKSDLNAFQNVLNTNFAGIADPDQWIRDNIDLPAYYAYRFVVDAIHHYDIGFGKNYFWYHNPVTNKWSQVAWDLDLTWTTTYQEPPSGGDNDPFKVILSRSAFAIEYKNYARELRDLLYNTDQVGQILDEYAALVDTSANGLSMVDADRAMWDYNPIMSSGYVNAEKAGQGRFYQTSPDRTFRGMVTKLKSWVQNTRGPVMDNLANDVYAPNKPTITRLGAATYPINDLRFRTSAYSDYTGTFAAMKWRIAEVKSTAVYEIDALWESEEITSFASDITVPPNGTFNGQPFAVEVGKTYRVRVKMKDSTGRWSKWSDPIEFVASAASGAAVKDSLRITELHYNPDAPPAGSLYTGDDFEYVELKNIGAQPINLLNTTFNAGITFTFPEITLNPGQYVLVVRNAAAFQSRHGSAGLVVAGTYSGALSNGGEQIRLVDASGQTILDFTYSDLWYPDTDGGGQSLVVVNDKAPITAWNNAAQWRTSRIDDGTPGADEITLADGAVIINEALTHTDLPLGDWIELHNTTDQDIDISGWYLSDSNSDLKRYRIPDDTILQANGYILFTQSQHFGSAFGLSELGERIVLSSANAAGLLTGYRDAQDFGAAKKEVAFGQYVKSTGGNDFVAMKVATPGQPNSAPQFGPVVITEIMYAPTVGGDEYIELYNASNTSTPLYDAFASVWKFTEGVTYAFPAGTILQPYSFTLVVGIDPAAFRAKYNISAQVPIFGPFVGILDDAGESVALAAPEAPEPDNTIPYYVIDRVNYKPAAPWPTEANGSGHSLARLVAADYGNDVANWAAGGVGGTPGITNFDAIAPQVSAITIPTAPVQSLTITFSEAVRGLDLTDLTLTRNGGANLLTQAQTLTTTDYITWTLSNLADLTFMPGDYRLTLSAANSGIIDYGGNPLASGATRDFTVNTLSIPGTSGDDTFYLIQSDQNLLVFRNIPQGPTPTFTLPLAQFSNLSIAAGDGNDTLILDFAGGDFVRTGELSFIANTPDDGDLVRVLGRSTVHMAYVPGAFVNEGAVRTTAGWVRFADTIPVHAADFPSFGFATPQNNARVTLDTTQPSTTRLSGLSNGQIIAPLTLSNVGRFTLDATGVTVAAGGMGTGIGILDLPASAGSLTLNLNGGVYDLNAKFIIPNTIPFYLNLNGSAQLSIPTSRNLTSLVLGGSSRLALTSAGKTVLRTGVLNITEQATLDINDDLLVLNAGSAAQTALEQANSFARRAFVNAASRWTGTGLTSTTARNSSLLGVAIVPNKINDQGARLDPAEDLNAILIKASYNGDVNFDGQVNLNDYFTIDSAYLKQTGSFLGFAKGDVNYDGEININDYFMVDSAYLNQGTALAAPSASAAATKTTSKKAVFSKVKVRKAKAAKVKPRVRR